MSTLELIIGLMAIAIVIIFVLGTVINSFRNEIKTDIGCLRQEISSMRQENREDNLKFMNFIRDYNNSHVPGK